MSARDFQMKPIRISWEPLRVRVFFWFFFSCCVKRIQLRTSFTQSGENCLMWKLVLPFLCGETCGSGTTSLEVTATRARPVSSRRGPIIFKLESHEGNTWEGRTGSSGSVDCNGGFQHRHVLLGSQTGSPSTFLFGSNSLAR